MHLIEISRAELQTAIDRHRSIPWKGAELTLWMLCMIGIAWIGVMAFQGDLLMHAIAYGGVVFYQLLGRGKQWREWYRRNVKGSSLVVMGMTGLADIGYAIAPGNSVLIIPRKQLPGFRLSLGGVEECFRAVLS